MADPFSSVAAVVSFVDVTIRACKGINAIVDSWRDAPNEVQRLRYSVQNIQSLLDNVRLYVTEYESSRLCTQEQQLLPEAVKNELECTGSDLRLLEKLLPPQGSQAKALRKFRFVFDERKIVAVINRLESRQMSVMSALQITAQ